MNSAVLLNMDVWMSGQCTVNLQWRVERQDRRQAPASCHYRWFIRRTDSSPCSFINLIPKQCSLLLCREGQPLLGRTSAGCVSVKEGGGLVLDLQSHSALRASHCLGPLFVQCLQREKGPAKGEGRSRAGVSQGARGLHLPSAHFHLKFF